MSGPTSVLLALILVIVLGFTWLYNEKQVVMQVACTELDGKMLEGTTVCKTPTGAVNLR